MIAQPTADEPGVFDRMKARMVKAGVRPEDADVYAPLIGDTPEVRKGLCYVRNELGEIIARLPKWVVD